MVRLFWAPDAAASALCLAPRAIPGGKPVIAVPGLTPSSLASTVGPVFVTVDPASTEKPAAVPSCGVVDEVAPAPTASVSVSAAMAAAAGIAIPTADLRIRERMAQPISITGISRKHRMQPATVR
jgi:hypothetical protein